MKKVFKKTRVKLILFSSIVLFGVNNCMAMKNSTQKNNRNYHETLASLCEACKKGNLDEVKNIVKNLTTNGDQENLNKIVRFKGQTLLNFAFRNGHFEVVKFLLANGVKEDLNKTNQDGTTHLHFACRNGHLGIVSFLLANGAQESLNITDKKGATPLALACYYGHLNVVQFLVQFLLYNGAQNSLNKQTKDGHTPLGLACEKGHLNVVQFLLASGAQNSLNIADQVGYTPLAIACHFGHFNVVQSLVQFLLASGAQNSLNKTTQTGYTPFGLACYYGYLDIVKFLLDNSAQESLNMPLTSGFRELPIHLAFNKNRLDIVFYLLNTNNATIEQINGQVVFSADLFKNKELFELLLNKITDANGNIQLDKLRDRNGDTLASYLIKNPGLISIILSNNRFLYATNNNYESGMRKLVEGEFDDEDGKNIIVKFIKAAIETNESIKISLKNESKKLSPETSANAQILTNFSNNLVNTSIVFNILSGTRAIKETAKEKAGKKARISNLAVVGDTFLSDEMAMEIMSFGYECFKNPKNKAVINKLRGITTDSTNNSDLSDLSDTSDNENSSEMDLD